uniref:Phosphoprotein n=1 Tax=Para molly bornavirus TaxID=3067900 RepID=A0AA48P909_9MONO|nr:TPA_asm: phosphoprotein [Para molly bornavirus]
MSSKSAKTSQLPPGEVSLRIRENSRQTKKRAKAQVVKAAVERKIQEIAETEHLDIEEVTEATKTLELVEERVQLQLQEEGLDTTSAYYSLLNSLRLLKEENSKKQDTDTAVVLEAIETLTRKVDGLITTVAEIKAQVGKLHLSTFVGKATPGKTVNLLPSAPPPYTDGTTASASSTPLYPSLEGFGF